MNKLTTLAAISMFAVIMGLSAMVPALAVPKGNSGEAQTAVCHFFAEYLDDEETELDTENSVWGVLYINEKALEAHEGHGDTEITTEDEAFWCVENQDGSVVEPQEVVVA